MDTHCADDARARAGLQDESTELIEMALRLDDAFTLVDQALAQNAHNQELRTALAQVPIRRMCSLLRAARQ
jgi:hypothetical protein